MIDCSVCSKAIWIIRWFCKRLSWVSMTPLGRGGGSGSVLNKRQRLAQQWSTPPLACNTDIEIVSCQPLQSRQLRRAGRLLEFGKNGSRGERHSRASVLNNGPESRQR